MAGLMGKFHGELSGWKSRDGCNLASDAHRMFLRDDVYRMPCIKAPDF